MIYITLFSGQFRQEAIETKTYGPLAHLVERLICTEEVAGSIPVGSTKEKNTNLRWCFSLLWKAEPCFCSSKNGRAGVAEIPERRQGNYL